MNADYSEEKIVQENAAEILQGLGWESYYAFDDEILSDDENLPLGLQSNGKVYLGRSSYKQVLLVPYLKKALYRFNPGITDSEVKKACGLLLDYALNNDLSMIVQQNRTFYSYIKDGISVETTDENGNNVKKTFKVINFNERTDSPQNERNDFVAVRELWMESPIGKPTMRADVIGFVNGIPLLFTELKRLDVDVRNAYNDNYKRSLECDPHLFYYNAFVILSNGIESKIGTVGSKFKFFSEWNRKTEDDEIADDEPKMHIMLEAVCNKQVFLDLVENFIIFDNSSGKLVKILARNHQYLGVNQAFEKYKDRKMLEGKIGVFWHTQGSGKSYSMLFLSEKIHRKMGGNPTIVIITDRSELNKQISGTFEATGCLGTIPAKKYIASSGEDLVHKLRDDNPKYIFTLIQKFNKSNPAPVHVNHDILLISDEAHRTNNGIFADNMCALLPDASRLGFTGTPLFSNDNITKRTFGDYVSVYDFQRAVKDGATVPLYYENRGSKLKIENPDIDEKLLDIIEQAENEEDSDYDEKDIENLKNQIKKELHIICSEERLRKIAQDFVEHYSELYLNGKAMFVSVDKVTAVRMYNYVQEYWQKKIEELEKELKDLEQQEFLEAKHKIDWMKETVMRVVISSQKGDDERFEKYGLDLAPHRKAMEQNELDKDFKDEDNPFRIVFVCAMWLTGFDVPSLGNLYLDKPLKDHTLMQTIARANRVNEGKENGLIVDYIGIVPYLEKALAEYTVNKKKTKTRVTIDRQELIKKIYENAAGIIQYLLALGIELSSIVDEEDKNKKLRAVLQAATILSRPPLDTKKRFNLMAGQFLRLYKYASSTEITAELKKNKGGIEAIYKRLNIRRDPTDTTDVMIKLQQVINEYIKLEDADAGIEEGVKLDISKINFELLQSEFEKVKPKELVIQELSAIIEMSAQQLLKLNPATTEYYKHYQEVIEAYNKAQDKAEIRKVFEELLKVAQNLTEEQNRCIREGFTDVKELAVYDMLFKESLDKKEIAQIKAIAKELLEKINERLAEMTNPFGNSQNAADIDVLIKNTLWRELPESYDDKAVTECRKKIFEYVQSVFGDAA